MASFAELLTGIGSKTAESVGDLGESITRGAQLAQQVQNMQVQRQQLEAQKEELTLNKLNKVMDAFQAGANFKDAIAKKQYFKNYIPGMVKALKLEDIFTPELMDFAQSKEVQDKLLGLRLDVQDKIMTGELRGGGIINYVKERTTPEELAMLDTESLLEQQKLAKLEQNKATRTETIQLGQKERQQVGLEQAPNVEFKKKVADIAAAYNTQGGRAGVEKNVAKIRGVIEQLKNNEIKLGTFGKNLPYGSHPDILARLDKKAKAAMDDVMGAVNLRAALADPNPTEKQINQIMSRAWDARLGNEDNIKKLEAMITELETAANDREAEFKKIGVVNGSSVNNSSISPAVMNAFNGMSEEKKQKFIEQWATKNNLKIDAVKKMFGVQ